MINLSINHYEYQVGGSLTVEAPSYVQRQADKLLYQALQRGEFCYVLNSRQMGKSSLLARTKSSLQQNGFVCSAIDLTRVGRQNMTALQWYKGVTGEIWRGFNLLTKVNLKTWWEQEGDISLLQKLGYFIEEILLVQFPQEKIVIFVDEIDSILNCNFSVDDFFALIRFCYNQRAINPEYQRISFAIFGVATPSDLIQDKTITPFNIGRAIELEGFKLNEVKPLIQGIKNIAERPEVVLKEILYWTAGQPFLTQKLCLYLSYLQDETSQIPKGKERDFVEDLVRSQMIEHWETQDEPEHFKTIRDRILRNQKQAGRMLGIYQQILLTQNDAQGVQTDDSREQIELQLSGLVVKQQGLLKVRNPIYRDIFNLQWVKKQLATLRPYSQAFEAWIASAQQDDSRLLRGQALKDTQLWVRGKSLSDWDYQFLAASEAFDRKEVQMVLEAERTKAVEAQLIQTQKNVKLQQRFLTAVSTAFVVVIGLTGITFGQYQKALKNQRIANLSEISALISSSDALFTSQQNLDALVDAIKARVKLQQLRGVDIATIAEVDKVLQQAVYHSDEYNRFLGHEGVVSGVAFSPNGEIIATAAADKTVKFRQRDGTLLRTLPHESTVLKVQFSPNGKTIVTASADNTVKLWTLEGELLQTFDQHQAEVRDVAFSPDGETIATASADNTLKLWTLEGELLQTLESHQAAVASVAFSPDGNTIASTGLDNTIKLWTRQGKNGIYRLSNTLTGHEAGILDVSFSPDNNTLASASEDGTVKLWKRDGTLLKTFQHHNNEATTVAFSPDGKMIASGSEDQTIKLYTTEGRLVKVFAGHEAGLEQITFSPDGETIASASKDGTVRLWQTTSPLLTKLYGHQGRVWDIEFSRDSQRLASTGADQTVKLWTRDGTNLTTFEGNGSNVPDLIFSPDGQIVASTSADGKITLRQPDGKVVQRLEEATSMVMSVAFSPNGQLLASGGDDNLIRFWQFDPAKKKFLFLRSWKAHEARVWKVEFSPDSEMIVSTSANGTVKLWQPDGTLLQTLKGHSNAVWDASISPDSQMVASASWDGTVKLWHRDGTLLKTLTAENVVGFIGVDFSPDGEMVAAATDTQTAMLWKTDGTFLTTLWGSYTDLMFSPDRQLLAAAGDEHTVILWNLQQIVNLDLLEYGCNWVKDYLRTNATDPTEGTLCIEEKD
ncbi:MAG: AAA-like domain-containing protein [Microcoleaceae cyanobacterium]